MQIREARGTDAAAIVRLTAEANPNMVVTPESWLHRRRTDTTVTGAAYGGVIVDPPTVAKNFRARASPQRAADAVDASLET
jgi:hypothetical protein